MVAALWLAVLVTGEVLHERRASAPLVGALRLLAALAFGGTVFQAAQTLQVPAYEPVLVGVWSLGALVHAYAARAVLPLLVGLPTGTAWLIFQMASDEPSGLGVVLCLITAGVLGVALGALHDRWLPTFAAAWRETGAALLLAGLFAAALPYLDAHGSAGRRGWRARWWSPGWPSSPPRRWPPAGAGSRPSARSPRPARPSPWCSGRPAATPTPRCAGADAHAAVSVLVYVLVAVAVAVVGTLRDSWRLTSLATAALVVFTTFQSFAVFALIVTAPGCSCCWAWSSWPPAYSSTGPGAGSRRASTPGTPSRREARRRRPPDGEPAGARPDGSPARTPRPAGGDP